MYYVGIRWWKKRLSVDERRVIFVQSCDSHYRTIVRKVSPHHTTNLRCRDWQISCRTSGVAVAVSARNGTSGNASRSSPNRLAQRKKNFLNRGYKKKTPPSCCS